MPSADFNGNLINYRQIGVPNGVWAYPSWSWAPPSPGDSFIVKMLDVDPATNRCREFLFVRCTIVGRSKIEFIDWPYKHPNARRGYGPIFDVEWSDLRSDHGAQSPNHPLMLKRSASSIDLEQPAEKAAASQPETTAAEPPSEEDSEDSGDENGVRLFSRSVHNILQRLPTITAGDVDDSFDATGDLFSTFLVNRLDWGDLKCNVRVLAEKNFTGPYAFTVAHADGRDGEPLVYSSFWMNGQLCYDHWIDPENSSANEVQMYRQVRLVDDK